MNGQVESNWNPRDCCVTNELSVAEECSRAMVVGMEECQWLLLEYEEHSVDELEVFGQVV